jgi:hypothetical protein
VQSLLWRRFRTKSCRHQLLHLRSIWGRAGLGEDPAVGEPSRYGARTLAVRVARSDRPLLAGSPQRPRVRPVRFTFSRMKLNRWSVDRNRCMGWWVPGAIPREGLILLALCGCGIVRTLRGWLVTKSRIVNSGLRKRKPVQALATRCSQKSSCLLSPAGQKLLGETGSFQADELNITDSRRVPFDFFL